MPRTWKDTGSVGDTPEMIDTCLHCTREYCVNCFYRKKKGLLSEEEEEATRWSIPPFDEGVKLENVAQARAVYENYCSGLTDRESAERLGVSPCRVNYVRTRLGLKRMPKLIQLAMREMKGIT